MGYCEEEDAICQTQQWRRAEGHYQSNLGSHNTWAVPQTDACHAGDGGRGWLNLQAGRCERSNLAAEVFQQQIPASAKSQRGRISVAEEKKSELRWRSGRLHSQTPRPFWRAMVGCTETLVYFLVLHEPMNILITVWLKKGFSWRGKIFFSHTSVFNTTSEISKWNPQSHL